MLYEKKMESMKFQSENLRLRIYIIDLQEALDDADAGYPADGHQLFNELYEEFHEDYPDVLTC